jgi:hypothetical protein
MARGGVERSNSGIERTTSCIRNKANDLGTKPAVLERRGKSGDAGRSFLPAAQAKTKQAQSTADQGEGGRLGRFIHDHRSGTDRPVSRRRSRQQCNGAHKNDAQTRQNSLSG